MQKLLIISLFLLLSSLAYADKFEGTATYTVCFTPAQSCTPEIVSAINGAQKQILVQAYSFTSTPIARALIKAYKRGVDVKVILDRSQFRPNGFSSAKFLTDYRIPVWIDYKPNIAHNKVMVIDNKIVITGSFNFTKAAEERNAENVIIINDSNLAKKYASNWLERQGESREVSNNNSPFEFKKALYKVHKVIKALSE